VDGYGLRGESRSLYRFCLNFGKNNLLVSVINAESESMKDKLDQYDKWKKRTANAPWPNRFIKQDCLDGISIGEELLKLGCHKDRDGEDIQERVNSAKDVLRKVIESEPRN
jgi:hypothetical protein